MAFKEVASNGGGGTFFKWDVVGKSITGRFVGVFQGKVLQGRQTSYAKFVEANGVEHKVNTPSVLYRRLTEEFKQGDVLRVTYTHDEKGSQPMPAKIFRIEKDDAAPTVASPAAVAPQTPVPTVTASVAATPSAADVAAAQALLASVSKPAAAVPASEYDTLLVKLQESNPKGAAAIKGALETIYSDPAVRLQKLKETLTQQGVAL